ncbi:hypothetical protein F5Y19DRAFT_432177 [Xylariaceae sp. FL1651]|nr:hypothetical protein F5Y19DRAFT_432177 [Xylariaceae sp. FL1651]
MVTFNGSSSPGIHGSPGLAFPFSNGGQVQEQSGYGYNSVGLNNHSNGFGHRTPQPYSPVGVFSSPKLAGEPSRATTPCKFSWNSPRQDEDYGNSFGKDLSSAGVTSPWLNQSTTLSFHPRGAKPSRQYERIDNEKRQRDNRDEKLTGTSYSSTSNTFSQTQKNSSKDSDGKRAAPRHQLHPDPIEKESITPLFSRFNDVEIRPTDANCPDDDGSGNQNNDTGQRGGHDADNSNRGTSGKDDGGGPNPDDEWNFATAGKKKKRKKNKTWSKADPTVNSTKFDCFDDTRLDDTTGPPLVFDFGSSAIETKTSSFGTRIFSWDTGTTWNKSDTKTAGLSTPQGDINREPKYKPPVRLAPEVKADESNEDDFWVSSLAASKKAKKKKCKGAKASPSLHGTNTKELTITTDDDWTSFPWGTIKEGKNTAAALKESFASQALGTASENISSTDTSTLHINGEEVGESTTKADNDWISRSVSKKPKKKKEAVTPERFNANESLELATERKEDGWPKRILSAERMDVDGQLDAELSCGGPRVVIQPQPVPSDCDPKIGKVMAEQGTQDSSKQPQMQEKASISIGRKTGRVSSLNGYYRQYEQPQAGAPFRPATYTTDYRPTHASTYPRYRTSTVDYTTSHHSQKRSSWGPDVYPQRERNSQYSYSSTAQHDDLYTHNWTGIDGTPYILPSLKRTRRSYHGYSVDLYTHQNYGAEPFDHYRYVGLNQRSRVETGSRRRQSSTTPQRPSAARPISSQKKAAPATVKATEADAKKHRIPAGYSLKNWDPSEEPITLLGSVFDSNALGKWIYDWTVFHHGPATPISDVAGDLWLLLIYLAGKIKRAEEGVSSVRSNDDREMLEDFIESGERLTNKLRSLLKRCEAPMLKAASNNKQLSKNAGIEFVETLFGRERELERTERFMQSVRLWILRFDANCDQILSIPTGSSRFPLSKPNSTLVQSSLAQPQEKSEAPLPQSNGEPSPASLTKKRDISASEVSSFEGDGTSDEEIAETLEDGHPLLQEVPTLVQTMLDEFEVWRTCKGDSGSSKTAKPISSNTGQNSTRQKKRVRESNEDEPSDDEAGMSNKNTKRRNTDNNDNELLLLACPFYKHDRIRHQKCLKLILKRIKDVKQHLYRRHKQPNYCPLCGQVFDRKVELDNHLISRTCERQEFEAPEGITAEQEESLKSSVDKKLTLPEQWKSVWSIVFPNEEPPESPFIQGPMQEGLINFREFCDQRGPTIISGCVQTFVRSHNLVNGIPNEERTQSALLETVSRRALDAIIEDYEGRLSVAQEDDEMPSMGNSDIITQATASQSNNQEIAGQLGFNDIDIPILPAPKPGPLAQDVLDQNWDLPSIAGDAPDVLVWLDLLDGNFGNGGLGNLFNIPNESGPAVFSEDTSLYM